MTVLFPSVKPCPLLVLLFVQLPPTLMALVSVETDTRLPPPVVPILIVRAPVTVNVWATVLLAVPLFPRLTVVVPVL